MADNAKEFRYAIALDRAGSVTADGRSPLDPPPRYRWRVNGEDL